MMLRRQSQQAGTCSYSSSYTIVSRLSIPNVLLAQGYNRSLLAAPGVKAVDWNGWHVTSIIEFALLFNFIFGFNITSYLYAYDTLSSSNWFKNPLISIDCIQKKKKKMYDYLGESFFFLYLISHFQKSLENLAQILKKHENLLLVSPRRPLINFFLCLVEQSRSRMCPTKPISSRDQMCVVWTSREMWCTLKDWERIVNPLRFYF